MEWVSQTAMPRRTRSDRMDCSSAMKGPTSLPLGESTPSVAATSSAQKVGCRVPAYTAPAPAMRTHDAIRVALRPSVSA